MFGYTSAEVVGRHTPSIFHVQSEVVARAKILSEELGRPIHGFDVFVEKARQGKPEEREWTLVRKDGTLFPVSLIITASRDAEGKLAGFLGIVSDITARKKADEILRASEERFRLIVDAVEDYALFMLDPMGCVVSWNVGAERINGYDAQEIIGRHFSCFYPAEDKERGHPDEELRIAAEKGHYEEEGWRVRKDGSRYLSNVVITAIRDGTGKLHGFAKVTRDVTASTKAAKELAESKERLNTILNSSLDGVIVYESIRDAAGALKDFRFVMVNPAAEKLMGKSASEVLGHGIVEIFPNVIEDGLLEKFRQIVEKNETLDFEYQSLRTNPLRWYRVAGVKLNDGLALSYADITTRKENEEALRLSEERFSSAFEQ
jgi:PAS domain S-box-containing protein